MHLTACMSQKEKIWLIADGKIKDKRFPSLFITQNGKDADVDGLMFAYRFWS